MELHALLDFAGAASSRQLIALLLLFLSVSGSAFCQAVPSTADRIPEVKKLFDAGRWNDVVNAVPESPDEPAGLELYRGLALAKLERWQEAKKAFAAGLARNPRDTRFIVELAGIAYHEKQFSVAKGELRRALAIHPQDGYANDFLASIYFLEGNLEAALKYWNRASKPKLNDLTFEPKPQLNPLLLDLAFTFSPGNVWRRDQFLTTQAQLDALDLFPYMRFDLAAQADGSFDLTFNGSERNGWGRTKWDGLVSLLRGVPYLTVYPEFCNLGGGGLNWLSLVRWDDEKRRISSEIAAPLAEDPALRYRIYFDARNENWNLTRTIVPSTASPASLNLETAAAGAEIRWVASGLWQWKSGVEYSYRKFRSLAGIPAPAAPFFTNGSALALRSSLERSLIRFPERRFTLDSSATGEVGTFFTNPLHQYGRIEGSLPADWFPQARGNDYEMKAQLRAGRTFGKVPFDELLVLGFDRDDTLWLRAHPAYRNGEKGNAPLGRNYVLANWEINKIAYHNGLFGVRAGPFLDSGKIYDPSGFFGSPKWLWDTGGQIKIRILGSVEFVLGYGKDLRSGNNSFFTTVSR